MNECYLVQLWLLKKPLSSTIACLLVLWPRKKIMNYWNYFQCLGEYWEWFLSFFLFSTNTKNRCVQTRIQIRIHILKIPPSAFFVTRIFEEFLGHLVSKQTFLVNKNRWAQNSARKISRICQIGESPNEFNYQLDL